MNTKLRAVTDAKGRPISLLMTAGQVSDYTGVAVLLDGLPQGIVATRRSQLRRRLIQGA